MSKPLVYIPCSAPDPLSEGLVTSGGSTPEGEFCPKRDVHTFKMPDTTRGQAHIIGIYPARARSTIFAGGIDPPSTAAICLTSTMSASNCSGNNDWISSDNAQS